MTKDLRKSGNRVAWLVRWMAAALVVWCFVRSAAAAMVTGDEVELRSSSVPGIASGSEGVLDRTPSGELALRFTQNGAPMEIRIPYAGVQEFRYTQPVTHHLGTLAALGTSLVRKRKRMHLFLISWTDAAEHAQVAEFEVSKTTPPMLLELLRARAPQACTAWRGTEPCGVEPIESGPF